VVGNEESLGERNEIWIGIGKWIRVEEEENRVVVDVLELIEKGTVRVRLTLWSFEGMKGIEVEVLSVRKERGSRGGGLVSVREGGVSRGRGGAGAGASTGLTVGGVGSRGGAAVGAGGKDAGSGRGL